MEWGFGPIAPSAVIAAGAVVNDPHGTAATWMLEAAHPEIEWISQIAQSLEGAETVHRGEAGLRRFWDEWHALWDVTISV